MTSYGAAPSHYLSARRRDPVKMLMEEVVTHRMLRRAIDRLALPAGAPLRVLDVGSGTGDGFALLTEEHGEGGAPAAGHRLDYLGLDADPEMVRTARSLHTGPGTRFVQGDVRAPLPDGDFDLYLSCGVPYSHLPRDEMRQALTALLRRGAARGRRFAAVVDVLGRYSVEWTPRWGLDRWNYAMTFFEDVETSIEEMMSFYDRASLGALIAEAASDAGVAAFEVEYTDRSVAVGRHTATRSFNHSIPPYRSLLNALHRGEDVRFDALRFTAPREGAPDGVLAFFQEWERGWNETVEKAADSCPAAAPGSEEARRLALDLFDHEIRAPRGLGTGHSLTATVWAGPDSA